MNLVCSRFKRHVILQKLRETTRTLQLRKVYFIEVTVRLTCHLLASSTHDRQGVKLGPYLHTENPACDRISYIYMHTA